VRSVGYSTTKTIHVLRLTQLCNILLLFYCLLLVSASVDHHQAIIYNKRKIAGACNTKHKFHGFYEHFPGH
jgi:hypothetical protein